MHHQIVPNENRVQKVHLLDALPALQADQLKGLSNQKIKRQSILMQNAHMYVSVCSYKKLAATSFTTF